MRSITEAIVKVCNVLHKAWGTDEEYQRLWGGLNMTLVLWLWRHAVGSMIPATVLGRLTVDQFATCAQALSASSPYLEWLYGRLLSNENRAPAFRRIKDLMSRRLGGVKMIAPAWAPSTGNIPGKRKLDNGA